jgi:probable rRNA maturation factor
MAALGLKFMIEVNNTTKNKISSKKLIAVAEKFARYHKRKNFSVSLAIVGDKAMSAMNRRYRGKNRPTDVLSFPELNEIIIDYAQIKRQAKNFGKKPENELIFILVHGLLHLIGYDDSTEKTRLKMIRREEDFLQKICYN